MLKSIIAPLGGDWDCVQPLWKPVKDSIDNKKPTLKSAEIKKKIGKILDGVDADNFPEDKAKKIKSLFNETTSWGIAKKQGLSWVPFGQPRKTAKLLLAKLEEIGLWVVPTGAVESFCPTVGGHGPSFVAPVLEKDLVNDSELAEARNFVTKLLQ